MVSIFSLSSTVDIKKIEENAILNMLVALQKRLPVESVKMAKVKAIFDALDSNVGLTYTSEVTAYKQVILGFAKNFLEKNL